MKKLTEDLLDQIVVYMDDDLREDVHRDLAPCSPEEFLLEFVKRAEKKTPDFLETLDSEFGYVKFIGDTILVDLD